MKRQSDRSAWQMDRAHLLHPCAEFATCAEQGSQVMTDARGVTIIDNAGSDSLHGIGGHWCLNVPRHVLKRVGATL